MPLDVARMITQQDEKIATLRRNMARLAQNMGESPFPDTQSGPACLLDELAQSLTTLHYGGAVVRGAGGAGSAVSVPEHHASTP